MEVGVVADEGGVIEEQVEVPEPAHGVMVAALRTHAEVVVQLALAHDVIALGALAPVALGGFVLVGARRDDAGGPPLVPGHDERGRGCAFSLRRELRR